MAFPRTISVLTILVSFVCVGFIVSNHDAEARLAEIAKEYKSYWQYKDAQIVVTDSSKYKWTTSLCMRPKNFDMGWHYKHDSLFVSKADSSASPHGNKLYRLFIKDYEAYRRNASIGQPLGQVVIKETWNVKEIIYDSTNKTIQQIQSKNDGKWYTPATVCELFIMFKEQENQTNDKGWNYGIVSIENKEAKPLLLNNDKISSCISCHRETKYDRIFGVVNQEPQ